MSLIDELKRRNVIKVAGAYLALGWVVVQATGAIVPALNLPASLVPTVVWVGIVGFPFVVVFSWVFELTPEGLKRESEVDRSQSITHLTSKRLDYIIIAMLAVAMLMFAADRFFPRDGGAAVEAGHAGDSGAAVGAGHARDEAVDSRGHGPLPQENAAAPEDKSIAVLPFVNMSSDKEQEYFSDGISEELLNLLAKLPELRVIARTSSFSYKGKDIKVEQIGQELRVAHVLEGSVRKSGNTVRITAQLIHTADSTHLWSETWDRPLDNIFAVQDEIAAAVVEQLKIKLLGAAPKAKAVDPRAYALYLQARQLRRQSTAQSIEQSIALNEQALAIEPGYAAAWDDLARAYANQAGNGLRPVDEAYALAREAVNKALASDPDYPRAHASLGWIAMSYDGDLAAAARHYQRALALDSTDLVIIANFGALAGNLGRLDDSIALSEYVVTHDPISAIGHSNLGYAYLAARRYDDAITSFRTGLRLSPGYIGAQASIGTAMLYKGDAEAALAEVQKEPDELNRLYTLALVYRALDRRAEADAALSELMQKYEKTASMAIASLLSERNEVDRAFEWLDKAVANHDANLVSLATADTEPTFDNVRKDPRWLPLLRKLGKAPEQLAAIPFEMKLPKQ